MSTSFADHFAGARGYERHRPRYPDELFAFLAGVAPGRALAWDCATGTGQAADGLARRFERVVATDASLGQLARAPRRPGVDFVLAPAEAPALADEVADLVLVAQALHWIDRERFDREARRVLRPGGILAVAVYGLVRPGGALDAVIERFAHQTVGADWPPERRWVDEGYRSFTFPFPKLPTPDFEMSARWSLEDLLGYLGTWSSVRRHVARVGRDPRRELREELAERWSAEAGDPADEHGRRRVRWPLRVIVGRRP